MKARSGGPFSFCRARKERSRDPEPRSGDEVAAPIARLTSGLLQLPPDPRQLCGLAGSDQRALSELATHVATSGRPAGACFRRRPRLVNPWVSQKIKKGDRAAATVSRVPCRPPAGRCFPLIPPAGLSGLPSVHPDAAPGTIDCQSVAYLRCSRSRRLRRLSHSRLSTRRCCCC